MRPSSLLRGLITIALSIAVAHASGPRWVTGPPYFTGPENRVVPFFTPDVLYFTDPGSLNANVTHAQAEAMVAAAAAVWNVPTSRLTLAQGGVLLEHVSSANTYFDGTKMVFPDDLQLANYHAKPIAIVYDTDGSVIDTLLGSGASLPSGCRQNAVVEDMDGLDPAGTIDHAILILNGRCVGSSPDQLTQMQYQLVRALGRVLGLAWAQLNDDVFTGIPTPTFAEMQNWPVMHPIDVICGPYTYKCMVNAFTLRVDDLSSLTMLYPVTAANIIPGKTLSTENAVTILGNVTFPTGQGMDSVNIVVRRQSFSSPADQALIASAVTGFAYRQDAGNLVTGQPNPALPSNGITYGGNQGTYQVQSVPIVGSSGWESIFVTAESINPLYSGAYAIAGYVGQPIQISGPSVTVLEGIVRQTQLYAPINIPLPDAANNCNPAPDGSEPAPVPSDPSGWWSNVLCSTGHTAWFTHTVRPGRTWTLEATALDEAGNATTAKARPLIGVFNAGDPNGTLPTVAATAAAFNSLSVGTTQLRVTASASPQSFRIVLADQRGQGRPDFAYKARLLYADTLLPTQVGKGGGVISITGEGFRSGNIVKVNGVAASVLSWTSTQIVAITPSLAAASMTTTALADVTVLDSGTGGSTTIQSALSYGGAGIDSLVLLSAPAQAETGTVSITPFAVRVLLADGTTPARGATVQLTSTGGAFTACHAATCLLIADANGLVQTTFTPATAGIVTLSATETSGGATVQALVNVTDPIRLVSALTPTRYVAANTSGTWTIGLSATLDALAAVGLPVNWSASSSLTLGTVLSITDISGTASASVSSTGLAIGAQATVQGCVWIVLCSTTSIHAVDPAQWTIDVDSGAGQSIQSTSPLQPVVFLVTDGSGHPVESATVTIAQTVDAWEGACPIPGRCPAAPVLASSRTTLTTDASGKLSITPLDLPGIPSIVNIAAITGINGFVTLSLTKAP